MKSNIKLSVLLPAFNAEKNIGIAIKSILEQSYTNFEFIIINDGSSDNTEKIIKSFVDNRIVYVKNKKNEGLIYTLNRGLSLARGEYIARMDADDVSLPDRFMLQLDKFNSNSNLIVCGTQVIKFYENSSKKIKSSYYISDALIKDNIISHSPFAHPSVMFRKDVLIENNIFYDQSFKDAEDYKLWVDLMDLGEFCNLEAPLLLYRVSSTQITQSDNLIQKNSARQIRRLILDKKYDIELPNEVDIDFIRKTRASKILLSLLLLSMMKYDIKVLCICLSYLIVGKITFITFLRVIKRFFKGPDLLI